MIGLIWTYCALNDFSRWAIQMMEASSDPSTSPASPLETRMRESPPPPPCLSVTLTQESRGTTLVLSLRTTALSWCGRGPRVAGLTPPSMPCSGWSPRLLADVQPAPHSQWYCRHEDAHPRVDRAFWPEPHGQGHTGIWFWFAMCSLFTSVAFCVIKLCYRLFFVDISLLVSWLMDPR